MARISSSSYMCVLVLTLGFLVFEIVVGRICRSLLIAVDSFHTLYIFINLTLSDYRRMRLKPFGVLISALLMASQCVSISLEILTHLVQPEPIQHPLLSIVVGGTSLIFNVLVKHLLQKGCEDLDDHCVVGSALQNDTLMFCNPEASRDLDPDRAELPKPSISDPVQSSPAQTSTPRIGGSSQEIMQHSEQLPEEPLSQCAPGRSGFRRQQLGFVAVIQDLLSSVLVLTSGLVLLLSAAHCHRPHSDCHLLVYLDAGFSAVCVLVLFSTALPRLRRYGLLVLQATPLHLSVAQVRLRLTRVPGVLSVHELHVWQLSEALLVASLHVHCPVGLNAAQCTDLMERITAALNAFGIKHCTVQPELIRSGAAVCSLCCGQECVEKLCCSPPETESPVCVQEEESCSPAPHSVDQIRDVAIENTYL
uniref:Cation efflux protein cytoplasmic domain-containing protein n=1 Tax=Cyprinus carpio TaxID=7962 RepID=A0A8C1UYE2_CYPCA